MDFSRDIIYEGYNKYYKLAEKAKAEGDLPTLKDSLFQAAEYLKLLSQLNSGAIAEEQLARANKMYSIAKSIKLPPKKSDKGSDYKQDVSSYNSPKSAIAASVPEEISAFLDFFLPGDLEFGFEEVIGLDEAKELVREYVINPRLYPKEYSYSFLDGPGILLEGPPGTGKTTFAKALSKELNQPFALVKVSGLINYFIGETSKNIDKIFDYLRSYAAKNNCEVTVFIDELDEIAQKRGGDDKVSQAAVPSLLRNLGGMTENKGLLVIANTNCKELLDKALVDRFRRTIYIPLPDRKSREMLFRLKLRDVEKKYVDMINFPLVAEKSDGMNGRRITYLCDDLKHFISRSKVAKSEIKDLTPHIIELMEKYR